MQLSPIVLLLRAAKTHFGNSVGGAADWHAVEKNTLLKDTAFVLPLGDNANENDQDNGVNQVIKNKFGVIVALKNDNKAYDKAGLLAYDSLDEIKKELLRVLVNLDLGYDGVVEYSGGRLVDVNAAWLWWRFEFMVKQRLVSGDDGAGYIEQVAVDERQQVSQLPDLYKLYADIVLSPSDNLPYSGTLPVDSFEPDASTIVEADE